MAGEYPVVASQVVQFFQGFAHIKNRTAGEIAAAHRAGKQGIAGEHGIACDQAYRTGRVAGGMENADLQTCYLDAAISGVQIRVIQRAIGHGAGKGQLLLLEEYPAIGIRCNLAHSAHMVKVTMGQQNSIEGQTQFIQLFQNGVCLITGVDDTAGFGIFLVDDVGIGLISNQMSESLKVR